jgi:hypothetical protein
MVSDERPEPHRKRGGAPRVPRNQSRLEVVLDLPAEKKAHQEDAGVGSADLGADAEARRANSPSSVPGGSRGASSGHVPLPRTRSLTAEQLLKKIGLDFLDTYRQDSAKAWENLMLEVITNLATLAKSELVAPVRDLINIAKDVEDQIRKSRTIEAKTPDGERRLPMDAIGAQWRLELPSAASPTTATTKNSRRNPASASKLTISSESPSSNEKTNSEIPGSES